MGKEINGIQVINDEKLVRVFSDIHKNRSSMKICFIIGAGASISSGIRTGEQLATEWLKEIESDHEKDEYLNWIKDKNINTAYPGESYSDIYVKRYSERKELGYDFINKEMQGKEPNIGYQFLGEFLNYKEHNVVITTNFDNLLERSIYTYQQREPLVCAHENLASFARPTDNYPLIAKIHRDKLYEPIGDGGVHTLDAKWTEPLSDLLTQRMVIALGYGGNDGSLMKLLQKLNFKKGLYWCTMHGKTPTEKVQELLKEKQGKIVTIESFDIFILKIWNEISETLKLKPFDEKLDELHEARKQKIGKILIELGEKLKGSSSKETKEAIEDFTEKLDLKNWWNYDLKADAAKNIEEKDRIYIEGLEKFPDSFELNGNYAIFLHNIKQDYGNAEIYYKKALELDPSDANNNGNYAFFLKDIRKDFVNAEIYYKKALELDPNNTMNNGNYANFLHYAKKDYNNAEIHYQKAVGLEQNNVNLNQGYANFLKDIRKNYKNAESYYKIALESDPNHANLNGNYAWFLLGQNRKVEATVYLEKAFENCDQNDLLIELWFYRYAHYPEFYEEAHKKLLELIEQGARSPDWNFEDNITQAEKDGHPNLAELKRLAKIITETE